MPLVLNLALRDIRGALRSFRVILLALALGVGAIAAIGTVKAAVEAGLRRDGVTLLGGDAEAAFTYRFASAEERAHLTAISSRLSEVVAFRSLAVAGDGDSADRALTEVRAVDRAYPLAGAVTLDPPMTMDTALDGSDGLPGAVMEAALADRLSLGPGDRFRLGTQGFVLGAILRDWPDNATAGMGFGPRTMVRTADLADSGLPAQGTLFTTHYRLDLPPGVDPALAGKEASARFPRSGLRWRHPGDGMPGAGQAVERLGSFLMLAALAGLAVGGVGIGAAVRSWLGARTATVAILRTLGATRRVIVASHLIEVLLLAATGIVPGLALGAALPALAAPWITAHLPLPADFAFHPAPLIEAATYGFLTATIFALWPLSRIEDIRPAVLLRDAMAAARRLPRWPWLAVIAAVGVLLVAAAARFTGSLTLTLWTLGAITAVLALLAVAALGLRLLARLLRPLGQGRPALRLALAAIAHRGGDTVATVLALGLGLAALATIGQVEGNLRRTLLGELPQSMPSHFFIDIQPAQIGDFLARLTGDPAVHAVDSAPMLRGLITAINGRPAQEVAPGNWVIEGDRGVSHAATPPPGTVITAGQWWPADDAGPPQMSFSANEAAALGLNLGDTVTLNILGREITATVTSFRQVEFQSAGIGFVIVMNPAALEGAPHGWIATARIDPTAEGGILRAISQTWPNVTAIGLREAAARIAGLIGGAAAAIRLGAAVVLVTGILVVIGGARTGEAARTREAAVACSLGATRGTMLWSFALRAALTGLAAGVVALLAGMLAGWAVTQGALGVRFHPDWPSAITITAGGSAIALLAGLVLALAPLSARPAPLLRARD
ncbi:MAG: FtsX-like permease family protein [Rubellimicrobium sp.]|nr:FtsX-like permease family protein [Rubellimicrobium sp.]